jgi:hypothetical protein
MVWYAILGIVIPVLGLLGILFKNIKWKKVVENAAVVLEEARKALEDGSISKEEFLAIIEKAIDVFSN